MLSEPRLIEGRFPCREVGAETQRERGASSALPPLYFLHVWWARRPLTPSRAAVLGSILPAGTDDDVFLRELGIVKKQAIIGNHRWTLVGKNLKLVENVEGKEIIPYSIAFQKALDMECERRNTIRAKLTQLMQENEAFANNSVLLRWYDDNAEISSIDSIALFSNNSFVDVVTVSASPAETNERIAISEADETVRILGDKLKIDPEDLYAYGRAYESEIVSDYSDVTIFDPTAGGGSIPFEALRLGCKVIANDLNPVATVIEKATLQYPFEYGIELLPALENFGNGLCNTVRDKMTAYYHIPPTEIDQTGLLFCRTVTCPHCKERTPLLNSFALQKKSDGWMVVPKIEMNNGSKHVRLSPVRLSNGKGPNGEDPEMGSVKLGVGSCLICGQAIEAKEIKNQACGRSQYGECTNELFCIAAVRKVEKKDKFGHSRLVKEQFFREPTTEDFQAVIKAEKRLAERWAHWEEMDLIPTDKIKEGYNTAQPLSMGFEKWSDMFTPRQLLGHLTAMETLHDMVPVILNEYGKEKGTAIITYLQFMIDKCLDYNSRQTRWEYTRSVIKGTFGRHDFGPKWTFGEMIYAGIHSCLDWGKEQILDSYSGMCNLAKSSRKSSITILNGSAANTSLPDKSVDVTCWDPPYYNNVQYAELSDFFYVWQKRTFKNLYPNLFSRMQTNKEDEAVANPVRHGNAKNADKSYELLMGDIFKEIRRVTKDDGLMVMMFTHKSQEAWETLIRALISNGWTITSTFPVDSEGSSTIYQIDKAAAASSIFITCRKRDMEHEEVSTWQGFGQTGVVYQVRQAVRDGLKSYEGLHLNAVDEMVASYGCALKVLSKNWPVRDGEEMVSPTKAMREASTVVAQYQMERLTDGKISANDLEAEAGMVMTMLGIYSTEKLPFDDVLTLSRSLNVRLENVGVHGYRADGHMLGIGDEKKDELSYAPVVRKGSHLRILLPEERNPKRLEMPQTEWDILQGVIMAYRDGDIPVARAYLQMHATGSEDKIIALLRLWADNCGKESLKKEADRIIYGLK